MATPAKPMPPDWRKLTFSVPYKDYPNITGWARILGFGTKASSRSTPAMAISHPRPLPRRRLGVEYDKATFLKEWADRNLRPDQQYGHYKPEALRSLTELILNMGGAARGMQHRFNAYWEDSTRQRLHEEVKTFGNEWSGTYGYGPTGAIIASYRDFAVWWGSQFVKRGIGLYFDNSFPIRAYDPLTTSAYKMRTAGSNLRRNVGASRVPQAHLGDPPHGIGPTDAGGSDDPHDQHPHRSVHGVERLELDLEWFYGRSSSSRNTPTSCCGPIAGPTVGHIPLVLR